MNNRYESVRIVGNEVPYYAICIDKLEYILILTCKYFFFVGGGYSRII